MFQIIMNLQDSRQLHFHKLWLFHSLSHELNGTFFFPNKRQKIKKFSSQIGETCVSGRRWFVLVSPTIKSHWLVFFP